MDSGHFDTLTVQFTRRRSLGLLGAVGVVTTLSVAETAAGKRKKKNKKKGSRGSQPGSPTGRCLTARENCSSDSQCCANRASPVHPGCYRKDFDIPGNGPTFCCLPTHSPIDPDISQNNGDCCGNDWERLEDGTYRCCVGKGSLHFGHPEHCCNDAVAEGDHCAWPPL